MHWFGGGSMVWMTLSWVIGVGFLAALVWFLVSAVNRGSPPADSPESILRRRYASGDINTEEFHQRLSELRKSSETR